jgi:hypothetical protein
MTASALPKRRDHVAVCLATELVAPDVPSPEPTGEHCAWSHSPEQGLPRAHRSPPPWRIDEERCRGAGAGLLRDRPRLAQALARGIRGYLDVGRVERPVTSKSMEHRLTLRAAQSTGKVEGKRQPRTFLAELPELVDLFNYSWKDNEHSNGAVLHAR